MSADALAQAVARVADLTDAMDGGISETKVLDTEAATKQAGYVAALRLVLAHVVSDEDRLNEAREFVTLVNTVWANTRDGRHAKKMAETRMEELARRLLKLEDR